MNNLVRFYILILILVVTLFGCTRNPLGEQIYQPIANANFVISHTCTTLSVQDSAYTCTPIASDTSSPVTWALAATTTCAWASIDAATGAITGTPLDAHVGTCNLVVGASQAIKSALPITIAITTMNIAPTLTITNAANITEDATATVIRDDSSVQASEEGDGIYYFDHANTTAPRCSDNTLGLTVDATTGAVTFAPAADYTGTCNIKVGFNDQTGSANATATSEFSITVNPVNDQPVLGAIANQSISENTAAVVNFSFNDVDSAVTCSAASLSFASNNSGLIDPSSITFGGAIPNCTATINPTANQTGVATLTLTGTDGALSAVQSFTVTVNAVNDPPTISAIANQTTSEDTAVNVAFVLSDPDSVLTCTSANLSVTSSDLTLMPLANVVFSGTFPNCVATFTPATDQNGLSNIQITVIDNGLPSLQASSAFSLSVTAVNDPPTITAIANQSTNEDTALALAFTMNDVDNVINCNAVTASTSDPSVIPVANIVFTGTTPNCTATLTPVANTAGIANLVFAVSDGSLNANEPFSLTVDAVNDAPTISAIADQTISEDVATAALAFTIDDLDSGITCAGSVNAVSANQLLIPDANIVIGGATPNCTVTVTPEVDAAGGPVNVTLTLTDSGNPLPALTATEVFAVTITPVNDVPTISAIANTTTNENTPTAAIAFTIDDVESAVSCAGSVVASSSDASRVASAGIVIAGAAPNCTVTVTPVANASGGPVDITLTLTDAGFPLPALTAASIFQLTITPVNNAPDISTIANQSVNEDASLVVNFTIGDVDSILNCSGASLSATSSDAVLLPVASIVFGGTFPNCTATITPDPNLNGTSNLSITVTDGTASDVSNFSLTVNPVNDAPTIATVADQTINEDAATAALAFAIGDIDSTVSCAAITATSSNTTLIPNANIVIGGAAPNCTVTVTPAANEHGGPATITLTLTDAGSPAPNLTASSTFQMTVTPLNDAPTISAIADQSVAEDGALVVSFTISDIDTVGLTCTGAMSATSSDAVLIPVANIVFAGAAPNCTATISPDVDLNGSSNLNFIVDDGTATASEPIAVTVTPVNDTPVISAIAAQTTNEDVALGVSFTIADVDNVLVCSAANLSATSSDGTLLPVGNIAFSGLLPNCVATLTPDVDLNGTTNVLITVADGSANAGASFTLTVNAVNDAPVISAIAAQSTNEDTAIPVSFTIADVDSTVTCAGSVVGTSSDQLTVTNASIVVSGMIPNCTAIITPEADSTGVANITLTLTDAGTPAPNLTDTETFALTVTGVNDAPTISVIADQSISEDGATAALAFTIADTDSVVTCASVTASSSNTTLIPQANVVIAGAAQNCTVTVTPAADEFGGPVNITLMLTDAGTPLPALTATEDFTVTVNAVNDAPVLSAIADAVTAEDAATVVNFTVADIDSVIACSNLNLSVSSTNTTLVPVANVVFGGTLPNCTATVTPEDDLVGTATLTVTLNDNETPNLLDTDSFDVTVTPVDDAPVISVIGAQSVNEDSSVAVNFVVTDIDSTLNCAADFTGASSSPAIVAPVNIVFTGAFPNCTATITPEPDENGAVDLTVIATDGTSTDDELFTLTINAINDAPTVSAIADQIVTISTPSAAIPFNIDDIDSTLDCSADLSATSANQAVIADSGLAFGGAAPNCTLTITPVASATGGPLLITVSVQDNGTPAPNLTSSTTFNATVTNPFSLPTISAIGAQAVNEDGSVSVNFTLADADSTLDCTTSMSAASTNVSLVPIANVAFSGAFPNCSALITPVADENGLVDLTFTVTDGTGTDTSTFTLTVNAINDAPIISAIGAQSGNEDVAQTINFTIDDIDSPITCATAVSATTLNAVLIPVANVVFTGAVPNCTATVTPALNESGTSNLTFTVSDGTLTDADAFTITVNAVNDAPVISAIANQNTNEDTALPVAFTISDVDSVVNCTTSLSATSTDVALIPVANISFGGAFPNCTATVTPVADTTGNSDLVFTVADGAASGTASFNFSVTPVNDAPTISNVADQTIAEDGATAALAFTIDDTDSTVSCGTSVTVSSSNTTVIPTANVVIAGTAPNCTVTVTPDVDQSGGPIQISLILTDAGTPAPNLTALETFTVTVTGSNDAPTISTVADQTVNEDAPTTALAFTIDDVDSTVACATSVTVSSSNTTLIPSANIVVAGTAPNCTVTVTPAADENGGPVQVTLTLTDAGTPAPNLTAQSTFNVTVTPVNDAPVIAAVGAQSTNEDTALPIAFTISDIDSVLDCTASMTASSSNTTLVPLTNIAFSGAMPLCTVTVTPAADENGTADLTLTVSDGLLSASTLFTQTVNAQNDAPVISAIVAQSTNEDTALPVNFTIDDVDGPLDCTTAITASSSNTTLIPVANVVFTGTAPNCIATVTPAPDENGATTLSFTVSDGSLTAQSVFAITVNAINDTPVISAIADQTIAEDGTTGAIVFTISDVDNVLNCTTSMTAGSSDVVLIPTANIGFGGALPNCTVTATPVADENGVASLTLTVTDGLLSQSEVFDVTVTGVNDAPIISALSAQSTNEDTAIPVNFTIDDLDSPMDCTTSVVASSSNTTIVPLANVVFSGTAPNCTATITPAADENGTVDLTFILSDGSLADADTFTLTVNAVNDAPVIAAVGAQSVSEDSALPLAFTISDVDTALDCSASMGAVSTNTGLVPASGVVFSGVFPACTVTITPLANQNGTTDLTLTVSDGFLTDADTFTLTVNAVNDAPIISAIGPQSVNEDNNLVVNFTVDDLDSVLTCTTVNISASSTVVGLVPVANIVLSGAVPNCTATITPVANANGNTDITLTINDNAAPNLQDSETFTMTVNPVNDAPVIAPIVAQSTNEDAALPLAFSISDVDDTLDCTTSVTATSTNGGLVAVSGVVFAGTATNCVATITPEPNQNGTVDLTFTVDDTALNDAETFTLTVNAIDDVPVISAIAAQSTNEDTAIAVNFTISDVETVLDCTASMTVSSSNTTLVPTANVIFSGAIPNCTATIAPAPDQIGTANLTLTVNDGAQTAASSFVLTVNAVNDAPIISVIAAQGTNEDTAHAVTFTITDIDSVLDCSTSVSASSSNTTVVPVANVVFAGAGLNCTGTVTPAPGESGASDLTFTVTDGALTDAELFTFTVNPVNDAPTISTVADQTINEDAAAAALAFTINDVDDTLDCSTSMTVSSSNTTIIPIANVALAGAMPNCTLTVTPAANQNGGPVQITLTVADGSSGFAQSTFNVTVDPVNDVPVISSIVDQTVNEDTATAALAFTIDDIDSTIACNTAVAVSSSNTTIIPNANIVVAGAAPNCTVTVTPAANQNGGPVQISLTLTDAGTPAPNLTVQSTFNLTVTGTNDAPTISAIADQTINEDSATTALAFTIDDADHTMDCSTSLTVSSSNTTIIPNANIVFGGTAPNCTVTVTPAANQNGGPVNISVTVADTAVPVLTAQEQFTVTVNAVNDVPTISNIVNQTVNEDTATAALAFTIDDIDSTVDCSSSMTASSSDTTKIPNANIVFGGAAPNCTVTVTPAAGENGGPTQISLTVTDAGTPAPNLTAQSIFTVTIDAINDAPTISAVANQTINEDIATAAIPFTISDSDSTLSCSTSVSVASSNTTVIPAANVVVGGTLPNCTVTVTPAANQNGGPVQISLTVTDAGTPAPNLTAQTTFNVTVNAVNDVPTISGIAHRTISENTDTGALAFTIDDVDSTVDCSSSSLTASSSNTTIIPIANIVFGGAASNCTVTVTPAANENGGPVQITLILTDAGSPAPNLTVLTTFNVTVIPVSTAPSISAIANQTINEDTSTGPLAFMITDLDNTLNCMTSMTASSSNTTLIPNGNIVFGGALPNCTVTITPAANQNGGPVQISLTVTDGASTAQTTFEVTVDPINDAPTISTIANQTVSEDGATSALALTINDIDSTLDCSTSVTASSSNTTLIPDANIVFGGALPNCTVTVTPAAGQNGGPVQLTLTVTDTGSPLPALTGASVFNVTVSPVNDAPTITPIANATVNEDNAALVTFDIADTDSVLLCTSANLSVSSTNVGLVPTANIVFGGTYPNCTATATPVANINGTTDITVTVLDNGTPNLQAAQTFTLTVNAVNDAPLISAVADQTVNEDVATAALAFTISDIDSTVSCATSVTASSSNTTLIPNANIVFGGTLPNCTVTVTPAPGENGGPVQISLTLTDAGTPAPNLTAQSTFNVTVNAINDAPTISGIANQTVAEDTATAALAFTIDDEESTVDCSSSMTVSSSNTTIIPNANIVIGGTAPNCTVTVTPAAGENGGPVQISLTLIDAGAPLPALTAQSVFTVTVSGVNDAPTISAVANQTINEDTATAALAFTIADTDSTLSCNTSVTASSSNTTIIPTANIVIGGTLPNCTVTVTPALHENGGPVQISLTVTDAGTPAPNLTAQSTFNVTVNAVNDVPTIATIAHQTINEDSATTAIALTINDVDSTVDCATSLTASSSNTTVIPDVNVVFGGTAPNCTVTVTPAAGENGGPIQISLTLTDAGTPAPNLTEQSTFNVTVTAVNDAPVISAIADQTINEDANTGALAFTLSDVDSTLDCSSSMTASSSNTTIIPNANVVFGGAFPNCTVTVTPAANQNGGPVQISVTVADGGTPNLTAQEIFTVTVDPINDAPTITPIVNQTVSEDTATAALAFNINDIDSTLNCTTSMTASSSDTTLIPTANVVFGGAFPNCTVTVTPALNENGGPVQISLTVTDAGTPAPNLTAQTTFDITVNGVNDVPTISTIANQTISEDGATAALAFTIADTDSAIDCASHVTASSSNTTVIPTANVVIAGSVPNCTVTVTPDANQNGGPIQISLTLTDAGTPAPNLTAQSTFNVTVNPVNDAPTIGVVADQTINEDANTGGLAFTIDDIDSTIACNTAVTVSSSNTTVIPNANVVVAGTAPNCTVTVTPAANQNGGPVQISLTLTDAGTPAPNLTAQSTFNVTVNAVNDVPTISTIANQTINEDEVSAALALTIDDIDSTIACNTAVTVSSSNTTVIPNANVVVAGTAPNCTVTITPDAGQNGGPIQISLTITDAGTPAPNLTAQSTFNVTVTAVNDAPIISAIADQTINEDSNTGALAFTLSDVDSTLDCSTSMTASSSNTTIIPNGNVVFGGAFPNCTVTVTPAANQNGGPVQISVTVADGGTPNLSAQEVFTVTVDPINDAPTIAPIANQTVNEDTATAALAFAISDIDSTIACNTAISVASSNTTIIPNANIVIGGAATNCTVTVTPALNESGGPVQVSLTVTDSGTPAPNLTAQTTFDVTVNGANDAPIISTIADQTINEDSATAALAFTIGDADSAIDCTTHVTASSSNTTVIPTANVVVAGSFPNCTVTVTPAANQNGGPVQISLTLTDAGTPAPNLTAQSTFNVTVSPINDAPTIGVIADQTISEDANTGALAFTIDDIDSTIACNTAVTVSSSNTTVIPNANVVVAGTAPNCTVTVTPVANQNGGPVQISLTLTDAGTPAPNLTAQSTFNVTVNAVNDVPVLSAIANQTINEDANTGALAFTISDVDSTLDCSSSMTASSSNTTLVPNANIVFGGALPNCTVTITPDASMFGTADITVTVTDAGTPAPNLTASRVFTLTVNPVNDAPTITPIADETINEDANVLVNFDIADTDDVLVCTSANLTASSSNTTLVPNANIVFGGVYPNCTATITPTANINGAANITITVIDHGTPSLQAARSFALTVNAVNDAPTISTVADQTINEDAATAALAFTISDIDSTIACNTAVTVSSSNTTVIPNANVVIGGTVPNCTVTVTPASNENGGPIQVSLTLTDAGTPAPNLTAQSTFNVTVNALNDAPLISAIANQTIGEDSATAALAFTISDVDSTVDCSSSMTASSSNTTIIPNANIVFGGTVPNCTVTVTPDAGQNGGPVNITLTVTDSGSPAPNIAVNSQFTVTVSAVNDAPTISAIADLATNEDTATAGLAFTINDSDSTLSCATSVTVSSSNTTIVPNGNIVIGGAVPNCTVTVTPAANQNGGPVNISLTLTDAGTGSPGVLTAQSTFALTVNAVNDVPTISAIANQTTAEDTATAALALTINDVDSTLNCTSSLTASSSNTTIIPNANVVFGGAYPNCTVTVTPAANENGGPVQISLTVTDGGTPAPNLTAQSTFNITVNAVNDAPTISAIVNQTINEESNTGALAFTINDVDSTIDCGSSLTASSSNTTIIPNANVVFGGTYPNCTVTVTPAANQSGGPVNISLTLTDAGTPAPNLTAQSQFAVTVNAINDAPTISTVADQTINEDAATAALAFTIDDTDSTVSCATSMTVSSSNTTIIPNGNIVIGGTAPNCTVTVTPAANQSGGPVPVTLTVTDAGTPAPNLTAQSTFNVTVTGINDAPVISAIANQTINEDAATTALGFTIDDVDSTVSCAGSMTVSSSNTTIIPNGNIVIGGTAPNCTVTVTPDANQNGGPVNISLTLTDAGTPAPNLTAQSQFTVTVNAVNDAPTISAIADLATNEDTATAALAFAINDADSTLNCNTSMTVSSSNTTIIPNANIVIGGAVPNCTVTVTPAANQNGGPVNISLTLTDAGTGSPGVLTAQSTFQLTVNAVNDAPVISAIAAQSIAEDGTTGALAFTISDTDSTLNCNSSMTASSSNTTLIPTANVVFGGAFPNCTVTVTPAANEVGGPSQITLIVTDSGTPIPALTASSAFNVTVSDVNDAPTISAIANQTINEDAGTAALAFTIDDLDSAVTCAGSVTVSSSNTTIVPSANIVIGGAAPNCTVTVTPAANQNGGPVNITLTLTDAGTPAPNLSVSSQFTLTVNAVNDAPVLSAIAAQSENEDNNEVINFTISDNDSTLDCTTSLTASSSNTALIPNANIVFSGALPNCTATITPLAGQNGTADLTFTVTDSGTPMPALTASRLFTQTIVAINDAPTMAAIGNETINEDGNASVAFVIADSDSTLLCTSANLSAASTNVALVPVANIVFGGTYPNCTAAVTPVANENGSTDITLTVFDNGAPNLQATRTFTFTVNAVNDLPTISTIANQTLGEDISSAALALTINDVDSTLNCATSVTASSSNTTLIPTGNIVIGGAAPNCTVTITPGTNQFGGPAQITLTLADAGTPGVLTAQSTFNVTVDPTNEAPTISAIANQTISEGGNTGAIAFTIDDIDSTIGCATNVTAASSNTTLIPNANIVIGGAFPNCTVTVTAAGNESGGPVQISLTLTDAGTPAPNLTAQSTFNVTVNPVNDAPTMAVIGAQSMNENSTLNVNFTIDDIDATLACTAANLTASSSNTTIVPVANITFSGTAPNCVATIAPATNQFGAAFSITLTVNDNGNTGSGGSLTAQRSFNLTVNQVNDAPVISAIANGTTNSDTAVAFTFTIDDLDATLACTSVNLIASSSNTTMIPVANIVFSGTAPNCTATVTPATNQNGQTQLTITVTDNGNTGAGGVLTNASAFTVTVRPKAPTNVTLGSSWTQTTTTPLISWTASTSNNKSDYEVGVTTSSSGGNATAGWTSIGGISTSYSHASIAFAECGTYYASVRTKDSVGTYSPTFATSVASFSYDSTDPLPPAGLTIIGNAKADRALNLSWTAGSDNCSLAGYQTSIGTTAGGQEVAAWSNAGNVTSYQRTGLTLAAATNYYINVRTIDSSGRTSSVVTMGPWNICATADAAISGAYTIPAGCYYARAKVWGGGGGRGSSGSRNAGGSGYAGADFSVTPGESLTAIVGGVGSSASGQGNAVGGANGGGGGKGGGAGGGRSEISRAGTLILVAGGGGGGGNASVGGAGCDGTAGGGAAGSTGDTATTNDTAGGGGGVVGGALTIGAGARGGTCSSTYAGGPTGQFGSFDGLIGATSLGGSGVNPGNAADANRAGAGRGEDATAGTAGLIWLIWP